MGTIYYQGQQYLGGTGQTYGGTTPPSSSLGNNGDYYYLIGSDNKASIVYVKLNNSWIEIYGGDVITGTPYYADYGQWSVVTNNNNTDIGMEGIVNE